MSDLIPHAYAILHAYQKYGHGDCVNLLILLQASDQNHTRCGNGMHHYQIYLSVSRRGVEIMSCDLIYRTADVVMPNFLGVLVDTV